jgi:hypothetical protein
MVKRIALVAAGLLALWILIQIGHDHKSHTAASHASSSAQSAKRHHRDAGRASDHPRRAHPSPHPAKAHPSSHPAQHASSQPAPPASSHPAAASTAASHASDDTGPGGWIIAIACIAAIAMSIFAVTISVSGVGRDGTPNAKASP